MAKLAVVVVSARWLRGIRSQSLSGNRGQSGLRRALWFWMVVYWAGDAASARAGSGQRTAGVRRVAVCRNVATVNVSGNLQERGASSKSSELEDAGRVSSKSERQPATLQCEQQQQQQQQVAVTMDRSTRCVRPCSLPASVSVEIWSLGS